MREPGLPEAWGDLALLDALVARASRPDFHRFLAQLNSTGNCARPVRLKGEIRDGDGQLIWSTATEPDGTLLKACGNRREAACAPCSETYFGDAFQLFSAGLRGGKGVPESVAQHPAVFVTLTAPSFGAVHTRRCRADGRPLRCRPRRDAPVCPHGVRLSCGQVHDVDDPCLGQPLCPDCYDYDGAIVWNNAISELWRRTTIYLPRLLARVTGLTHKQLRLQVRPAYAKVAEYQQRGLVHYHAVLRLDRAMPKYRADEIKPPPPRFDAAVLEQAVRATLAEVAAPLPAERGAGHVRWGDELDVKQLHQENRARAAGYLAKYSTKSTELAGGVHHRVREHEIDRLNVSDHVRRYLRAAYGLQHALGPERRFARYAHAFGYRGHCLTKSRRYSTTFKALREARERWVHEQLLKRQGVPESQRKLAETAKSDRVASFRFVGQGYLTTGDALLANSAAARAREARQLAREERWMRTAA